MPVSAAARRVHAGNALPFERFPVDEHRHREAQIGELGELASVTMKKHNGEG